MNRTFKFFALAVAPLVLILGLTYVFVPGLRDFIDHWSQGVKVAESPGAKFISYRIAAKGDWHDKRFDSSIGNFYEDGAWIYFQISPAISHAPQITSAKDFQRGVYALAESTTGEKVPLQIETRSNNDGIIAVNLPARFPPTLKELDVTLFDREKVLSKVHLSKLPRTIWKTAPDAKPNLVYQSGTIKVAGSAHVESPKSPSGWSWLVYRINLSEIDPAKHWRLTNFRAMAPYQGPNAQPGMSFGGGTVSFELDKRQSHATAQWFPYNSMVKRLTVQCSLDRFDTREETVDFGIAQIQKDTNPNSNYPGKAFYLTLTKPIVRVMKDGTKLSLTPMLNSKEQNMHHSDETLYIRLSAEPAPPSPADGSLALEYQLVSGGRNYFSGLFPDLNPTIRFPDLRFIEWKSGNKQIHLKFKIRTLRRLEHHPISLTLPVEPLPPGKPNEMSYAVTDYWPTSTSIN